LCRLQLDQAYPFLVVDASYENMREAYAEFTKCGGNVKSDGVLTVKAITAHGHREIIDMDVAPGEEKAIWSAIFDDFLDRGLDPQSVHLLVSDEH